GSGEVRCPAAAPQARLERPEDLTPGVDTKRRLPLPATRVASPDMSDHPRFDAARLATSTPNELTRVCAETIETVRASIERVRGGMDHGLALVEEYDEATAALSDVGDVCQLVAKTHPDPAMRTAAEAAEQELQKLATDISLDHGVYAALAAVDLADVDPATRHWVERTLRDFRRAGVDRDDETRARVRRLREELVEIGQAFARNINSDTRSVKLPPA